VTDNHSNFPFPIYAFYSLGINAPLLAAGILYWFLTNKEANINGFIAEHGKIAG
jgi:hypothetical protein